MFLSMKKCAFCLVLLLTPEVQQYSSNQSDYNVFFFCIVSAFKSLCGHVITDEADLQNLDCELFVDEPSSTLGCLSSNSMPVPKPTPG